MTWLDKIRLCLIYTIAVTLIILAVAFSVLRAVLPHATGYVDDVEQELSQQIGLPISIARIDADMYWLVPRLKLVDVVIYDKDKKRELLRVDEAFFALAFVDSILQWSPTVGDISMVGTDLYIERISESQWRIQGVEFGGDATDSSTNDSAKKIISAIKNTNFSLLDSDIHWKDYSLSKESFDFIGANVFIEEFLDDHSLEINVQLPKIYGKSLRLIVKTDGDITYLPEINLDVYLQADSINLEQWVTVLDIAELPLLKGVFSGELWLTKKDDVLSEVTMDASVTQLNVVRKDYGSFSLDNVTGKFGWEKTNRGWVFSSRDIYLVKEGVAWAESASVSVVQDATGLSLVASYFRFQDILNVSKVFFDDDKSNLVRTYRLDDMTGDFYNLSLLIPADDNEGIKFATVFDNVDLYVPSSEISFGGIDGLLMYGEGEAEFEFLSESVKMNFGKLFRQTLNADLIEGVVHAVRTGDSWTINADDFYFLNSDGEINTRLKLVVDKEGTVFADIQSDFRNVIGAAIHKYYPVPIMSTELLNWLDVAITDGFVESGSFILRGDLNHIPYQAYDGVMQVSLDVNYLSLKFFEGWPRLENFNGHIRSNNSSLSLTNVGGQVYRAVMSKTTMQIPDLNNPRLYIESHIATPAADLQQYVFDSGLNDILGEGAKYFQASGETELEWKLEIPLVGDDEILASGILQLKGNELYIPMMDYMLNDVSGSLLFEGDQISADTIKANFEDTAISIDVESVNVSNGNVVTKNDHKRKAAGKNKALPETVVYIKNQLPIDGMLKKFKWIPEAWTRGSSVWDVAVHFPKVQDDYAVRIEMSSQLEGIDFNLTDALSKKANDLLPVDIEIMALDDALQVNVKSENRFTLLANRSKEKVWDFSIDSSLIHGKGSFEEDLNKDSTVTLDLEFIDLLTLFENNNKNGNSFSLKPTFFPSLNFSSKALVWNDWKFSNAKLDTSWHTHGMLINSLSLLGPSLQVDAHGSWLTSWQEKHESNFKVFVKSDNFGHAMSELKLTENIIRSEQNATIDWRWFAEPYQFSWQTVQGSSHFVMKDGGIKTLDPGAGGRIVGLFNIFKLFDRLTLDFKDVSGAGFSFDTIKGDFVFDDGFASTKNIEVSAAAADMKLNGRIGMVDKDYDLTMQVQPHSSSAVFTTGLLYGGAGVGAGLVLVKKLLGLGEDSYDEYRITGSWDDPQVDKMGE